MTTPLKHTNTRFSPQLRELSRPIQFSAVVALVLCCLVAAGCRGSLFSERDPRSQYDRYDRSRGDHQPMFIEDEFGIQRPNLTGRLGRRE